MFCLEERYCSFSRRREKIKQIEDDLIPFIENKKNHPGALMKAHSIYTDFGLSIPEKQKLYGDKILKNYANTVEAEWIRIQRIRDYEKKLSDENIEDWNKSNNYRKLLKDYTKLPNHYHTGLLIETYRNLFHSFRDDSTVS